jgi:hypothetical protein
MTDRDGGGTPARQGATRLLASHRNYVMTTMGVLLTPLFYAFASATLPVPNASATSECYQTYYWSGYVTDYHHNQGIEGDLDSYANDIQVYDDNTDHGLVWLGDISSSDPNNEIGQDWNQVGYMLGTIDDQTTDTTEVYDELVGPATQGDVPTLHRYPESEYPWDNRWFTDSNTGETEVIAGNTYGLYEGTYSLDYDDLGTNWMIMPTYTWQESNTEAYLGDSNGWCPYFSTTPFGTTGDLNDPAWNSSTELEINDNTDGGEWELWTPSSVATEQITTSGPYSLYSYSSDDAWFSSGGGP